MSHVLVLRHGPLVGPERARPVLDAHALPWVEHDLTVDPDVPALIDDVVGLLVLGGIMNTDDDHPWLEPERALLREAVAAGLPTLCICLGAQQLGAALGGEVRHTGRTNAALAPLAPTAAGREHPVVGGWADGAPAVFHNGDEVAVLPAGAVLLMDGGPTAAPAWTDATGTALAVQFHPEAGPSTVRAWEEHAAAEGRGHVREDLLAELAASDDAIAAAGTGLVARWLDTLAR